MRTPSFPPLQSTTPADLLSSLPHVSLVFEGINHRLPSCSVSLFFQTAVHVHLAFMCVLHCQSPHSNAVPPVSVLLLLSSLVSLLIYPYASSCSPLFPLADSLWFAAGSQSAVVWHPLLEQPQPRCPAQPRPAAGPQLLVPGKKQAQQV